MNEHDARLSSEATIEAMSKFADKQKNIKRMNLEFWRTIITIQATILGISIALMGYLGARPGLFLVATWILEIACIALGFVLFKIHIDTEDRASYKAHFFSMDMLEINMLEAEGKFRGNEERKTGMILAAFMRLPPEENQPPLNEYGKELANRYRQDLQSEKLFTKKDDVIKKAARLGDVSWECQMKLVNAFYVIVAISFVTLLVSILTR